MNVENAIGSPLNDVLSGDGNANVLDGGGGTNTFVTSGGGPMTISLATGTAGIDTLLNIQNAKGTPAGDTFVGTAANNAFDGSGGTDTIDYSAAVAGVTVNLALGTAGGQGSDASPRSRT